MATSRNASTRLSYNLLGGIFSLETDEEIVQLGLKTASILILSLVFGRLARNRNVLQDTIKIAIVFSISRQKTVFQYMVSHIPHQSYIYAVTVVCLQVVMASRGYRSRSEQKRTEPPDDKHPLPPLIFPCRTTHTRLFPTKHSFAYSYLFVGIPIGWNESAGSLLSTEQSQHSTWYSVDANDYLARGSDAGGLRSKLDAYLATHNVSRSDYPYAYLVTAPRFLGFSFNPVSFWYLYDGNKALAAMILEVNNTFDERRMYFMRNKSGNLASTAHFTNDWTKDFHVSPFNDRGGSYSLTAKDPIDTTHDAQIDNNIVLRSEDGKAKVVARVFSSEASVNPRQLNSLQSWRLVARWWWVGFMTNPRILREARTLWAKKLKVFYRPEVLATSIGRNQSKEEAILEPFFRAYLQNTVQHSLAPTCINYIPAAGIDRDRSIKMISEVENVSPSTLEIKILTPAFYVAAAKARSISHAFERFGSHPAPGAKMIEVSDSLLMHNLLQQTDRLGELAITLWPTLHTEGVLKIILKVLIPWYGNDAPPRHASDLDASVFLSYPADVYRGYSLLVTKLLLADRIALGFMPLLNFYAMTVWCTAGYFLIRCIETVFEQEWDVTLASCLVFTLFVFHSLRRAWIDPEFQYSSSLGV